MILEAILRTIDPLIEDEKVIKRLRDGNWNIYGSEHGEEPHGRFVAVYEVFVDPEDIEDGRCPPGPTFAAFGSLDARRDKKKALKKYIDLSKLHESHSREYLLDLGDYPGDPTESTKIIPVEVSRHQGGINMKKDKDLHILKRITFVFDEDGKIYREDCDGHATKVPAHPEVPTDWFIVLPLVGKFLTPDEAIRRFSDDVEKGLPGRYAREYVAIPHTDAYQIQDREEL